MSRPPLAVTMGDPAGCGPQITAQAWLYLRASQDAAFFSIADPDVYSGLCPVYMIEDAMQASAVFQTALPVLPLADRLPSPVTAGTPEKAHATATIDSIVKATGLALAGQASGVVTNPISKAGLYAAGFAHPGHTEFIAELCSFDPGHPVQPVMMLVGGGLRVALATIHMPLMQVGAALSVRHLVLIGQITAAALRRDYGFMAPRLTFSGLNPHAGESGSIGREEVEIINPAAAILRSEGIDICDARPGDTVFHEALSGRYDAVIAMTHDQGLIPVKTLDLWGGVNVTLGLPIIRTSPDHGTAYEAAREGSCRPDSLLAALGLAAQMAANRAGQLG